MIKKFYSPCFPPEGRNRELLTCLAEECNEVAVRVSKALRFGLEEVQPGQPLNNAERILEEYAQVLEVMKHLVEEEILHPDTQQMTDWMITKRKNLNKFLQFPQKHHPDDCVHNEGHCRCGEIHGIGCPVCNPKKYTKWCDNCNTQQRRK